HAEDELLTDRRKRGERVTPDVPDGPVLDGDDAVLLCRHRSATGSPPSKPTPPFIAYQLPPSSALSPPLCPECRAEQFRRRECILTKIVSSGSATLQLIGSR